MRAGGSVAVFLGLSLFSAAVSAGDAPFVRVRIAQNQAAIDVEGFDLRLHDKSNDRRLAAPERRSRWRLACSAGKVSAAKAGGPELSAPVMSLRSPAGFVRAGGRLYRQELRVKPAENGGCEVVNRLSIEYYLDGLVNSEFSASWDADAVAAQVVAARSYALYRMREAEGDAFFDLDATVMDQVYDGAYREDYRASRAVKRTAGIALAARSGKRVVPVKAFYHSVCGGETRLPEQVWGKSYPGFKRKVKCPYCRNAPGYNWDAKLDSAAIRRLLRRYDTGKLPDGWPELGVRTIVASRGSLRIGLGADEDGPEVGVPARWFRFSVGTGTIKSTRFEVEAEGNESWRVSGRGFGHGVGLCQWGAKRMGEKGFSMAKILKHYYPDTFLKKFW